MLTFCRDRPRLANFFFLPFQISNHIRKAIIFNKNEGNNQKVENKVTGRVSVGKAKTIEYLKGFWGGLYVPISTLNNLLLHSVL